MRGVYRVYQGGILVAEGTNLITTKGKRVLAAYLAKEISDWATFFQVGVGDAAPTVDDYDMEFYSAFTPSDYSESSSTTYQVTVRGTLDVDTVGKFYEVGIFSADAEVNNVENVIFTTAFDGSEGFLEGNFTIVDTYTRNGSESTRLQPADATTEFIRMSSLFQGYETLRENDIFKLAYANANGNASDVTVRYEADVNNYFEYSFAPASASIYNIHQWTLADFTTVGSPSWSDIQAVSAHVTAAGGAADLHLDGLYAAELNNDAEYGLVSRAALGSPIVKEAGVETEITYTLDFNF